MRKDQSHALATGVVAIGGMVLIIAFLYSLGPDTKKSEAYTEQAAQAMLDKKYDEAIHLASLAIRADSNNGAAYYIRGASRFNEIVDKKSINAEKYSLAEADLEQARSLSNDDNRKEHISRTLQLLLRMRAEYRVR
jgi:hypothetical protein